MKKGFAVAIDDLGADRPVAMCFAERLNRVTPIEPVKSKDDADVVFKISAHVASDADRSFAALADDRRRAGLRPDPNIPPVDLRTTSTIAAELPDGTALWSEKYLHGTDHGDGVECRIADALLVTLRDAMKSARDGR